jgi:hypothetical protein
MSEAPKCAVCGMEMKYHGQTCSAGGQSELSPAPCSDALPAGTFIRFEPRAPNPKTKVWAVVSKDGGEIGAVNWYGPWRKYCFTPNSNTVFEQVCLREIAQFCETATRIHKQPNAPGEPRRTTDNANH